jgi:hypothetical protein
MGIFIMTSGNSGIIGSGNSGIVSSGTSGGFKIKLGYESSVANRIEGAASLGLGVAGLQLIGRTIGPNAGSISTVDLVAGAIFGSLCAYGLRGLWTGRPIVWSSGSGTTVGGGAYGSTGKVGSGVISTEPRDPSSAFTQLKVSGVANVQVLKGDTPRIEVTTDDNLMSHVRTDVSWGGVLSVGFDPGSYSPSVLNVKVTAISIDSVQTSGTAKVSLSSDLVQDSTRAVTLEASGSSKLNLAGVTALGRRLQVTASGSSYIGLSGFNLGRGSATLRASGASKVSGAGSLFATQSLEAGSVAAEAAGASSITLSLNVAGCATGAASGASKVTLSGTSGSVSKNISGVGSVRTSGLRSNSLRY